MSPTADIPTITLSNGHGVVRISLLGATVIDWTPAGQEPVIWLSPKAMFTAGKGIRGGVPICWPWFGAHPTQADFPQHGFARSNIWQHKGTTTLEDGRSRAEFVLPLQPDAQWPFATTLEYRVTLGASLELELTTHNLADAPVKLTQALHTYFNVGDIEQVSVHGLDGKRYLDKPDGFAEKRQSGPISFDTEVDRVYLDTIDSCVIEDAAMSRKIHVDKLGSQSTVVWNPWQENSAKMSDMEDDSFRSMVCVETTNAAEDSVLIGPGEQHTLTARYQLG